MTTSLQVRYSLFAAAILLAAVGLCTSCQTGRNATSEHSELPSGLVRAVIRHAKQGNLYAAIRDGRIPGLRGPMSSNDVLTLYFFALDDRDAFARMIAPDYHRDSQSFTFSSQSKNERQTFLVYQDYIISQTILDSCEFAAVSTNGVQDPLRTFAELNGVTFPPGARFVHGRVSRVGLFNTRDNHQRFEKMLRKYGWPSHGVTILDDIERLKGPYEFYAMALECGAQDAHESKSVYATHFLANAIEGRNKPLTLALIEGGASPKSSPQHLLEAAAWGEAEVVELLLRNGASVDAVDSDGCTPLLRAVDGNHRKVVQVLLRNNADVNHISTEPNSCAHNTALHSAVGREDADLEIIRMLLDHGALLEARSFSGWTPLGEAAGPAPLKVIKLLLDAGAEPNPSVEWSLGSPLVCAAWLRRWDVVNLLLDSGANEKDLCKKMVTPLGWSAALDRREAILDHLKSGADINEMDGDGRTAVFWAARCGRRVALRLLLEKGAKPNIWKYQSPLHAACGFEDPKIVELLVGAGASLTAKNQDGVTAGYVAVSLDRVEDLDCLLRHGLAINSDAGYGWTLLHKAALLGHQRSVKYLLRSGANVNVQNTQGDTPLHVVVSDGNLEVVELLCKAGANPNLKGEFGTALRAAGYRPNYDQIRRILVKHGGHE